MTDANAHLFKGGYDSVLKPLYKNGTFKKGPDQFVPGWDNQKAATIFDQMLVKTGNKIDGVAAANDGIAGSVVADLKAHGLKPIPLSGQDATPQGFQYIISGWQTMTVWKDTRILAKVAAASAISLLKGTPLKTTGTVPNGKLKEPAYIIPPVALYKSNWTKIYTSGFLKKSDICTGTVQEVLQVGTQLTRSRGAPRGAPTVLRTRTLTWPTKPPSSSSATSPSPSGRSRR